MKQIITFLALVLTVNTIAAQKVTWSYKTKKIASNKYELNITATPPAGWHIYSQNTPDGGPLPTTFTINKNPLVTVTAAKPKENGKLVTYFDKNFKTVVKYFEGKVNYTQTVTIKGKAKTNITGQIESMICNDKTCMPPSVEKFTIALQ